LIISSTPLRISLFGGGTDQPEWYNNHLGFVVGSTIDKYVYVIVSKRFDKKIVVGYSKQETVDSIDEIQHELVRESAKLTGMTNGFEVKTMSDVPSEGSGLGSSSAILVGLLKAFYEYKNNPIENWQIAKKAFYIERTILNKPVGKQDHYYAAVGGGNTFEFDKNAVIRNPCELSEENLYLFYTGITRKASNIL
jgi:D-glycero-alpha-D-manno-heptose-7-phosphate kinase